MRVNKSSKGRPPSSTNGPSPSPETPPLESLLPEEELGKLSTLQLVDMISHRLAIQGQVSPDMMLLRHRVSEMEETQDQARTAIEKLSEAVDKLRAPALRLGTLLQKLPNSRALVCASGTDYICNLDPGIPEVSLETGVRVVLNEEIGRASCRERV